MINILSLCFIWFQVCVKPIKIICNQDQTDTIRAVAGVWGKGRISEGSFQYSQAEDGGTYNGRLVQQEAEIQA